ncbi:type 4a pilus biogenesis protein PilO [Candidatus Daviesbacteria bacterium]|nr:type 4a pilus biogenesis protein PilO [Candidatus Daviesbacteria bacterium]
MASPKYSRYYTYIKPVAENKLVRSLTPYIFSLITIALLIIFAIRPTVSTILNLQKNITTQQQVLKSLSDKASNLTDGRKNLQSLDPTILRKIQTLIPDQARVTSLISSLNQATIDTHATISALQLQPVTVVDATNAAQKAKLTLGEIPFIYNAQGSFNQLLLIIQELTKSSRLLDINSVILSKQSDEVPTLSINGKAYFIK